MMILSYQIEYNKRKVILDCTQKTVGNPISDLSNGAGVLCKNEL
jgi:hypothetical protein